MSNVTYRISRRLALPILVMSLIQSQGYCAEVNEQSDAHMTRERVGMLFQKCVDAVQKQDYEAAEEYGATIEKIGPRAVPTLLDEVDIKDKDRCYLAIACLYGIEPLPREAAAPLIEVLEDSDDTTLCGAALRTLQRCHYKWAKDHPKVLERCLQHSNPLVRREAVIASGAFLHDGKQWMPRIRDILKNDPDKTTRNFAATALVFLAPDKSEVVGELIDQLDGPAEWGALKALGYCGIAAKSAIPAIVERAKKGNDDAIWALAQLGPVAEETVPTLIEWLNQEEMERVRDSTIVALGRISPDSDAVIEAMRRILRKEIAAMKNEPRDSGSLSTVEAVRVLAKGGQNARIALPELKECLDHKWSLLNEVSADAILAISRDGAATR